MGKILLASLIIILVCSVVAGVLLGVASGLIDYVFHKVVADQINQRVTLEDGHMTYEQLRKPSIPTYKSFYFFNLTNPQDFEEGDSVAILTEIGPYSYREYTQKTFIESSNSSYLSYTQTQQLYYDANVSSSSVKEDDVICTINIPLIAGVYAVLNNSVFMDAYKYILNYTSSHLYTCQTASDLIWGYTDSLLEELYDLGLSPTKIAQIQSDDSSDSEVSTIHTGVGNISRIAQFVQWNGHEHHVNAWPENDANIIRGTEGIFFKPNLQSGEELEIFVGDLQRSFKLKNTAVINHLGLKTLRYKFSTITYESAFTEAENSKWGSWCPDGLFYLGPAKNPELPLYGSKPHFLDGDMSLMSGVEGMEPSRDKHESHMDMEPNIGATLDASIKLQLNIRVNTSLNFSFLENLKGVDDHGSLFFPVLYINEHAEFSEKVLEYLESSGLGEILFLESLASKLFYVLVSLACGCGLVSLASGIGIIYEVYKLRRKKKEEMTPLINPVLPTAIVHKYYAKKLGD